MSQGVCLCECDAAIQAHPSKSTVYGPSPPAIPRLQQHQAECAVCDNGRHSRLRSPGRVSRLYFTSNLSFGSVMESSAVRDDFSKLTVTNPLCIVASTDG